MIFKIFILFSAAAASRTQHRREFCHQDQLENIVRLSHTVQKLYEVEFTVIQSNRRRRHHVADLSQGVMKFYTKTARDLENVSRDLYQLNPYDPVYHTIIAMIDMMAYEVDKTGKYFVRHTPDDGKVENLDLVRARMTVQLSRLINEFHSVGHQCMFGL